MECRTCSDGWFPHGNNHEILFCPVSPTSRMHGRSELVIFWSAWWLWQVVVVYSIALIGRQRISRWISHVRRPLLTVQTTARQCEFTDGIASWETNQCIVPNRTGKVPILTTFDIRWLVSVSAQECEPHYEIHEEHVEQCHPSLPHVLVLVDLFRAKIKTIERVHATLALELSGVLMLRKPPYLCTLIWSPPQAKIFYKAFYVIKI